MSFTSAEYFFISDHEKHLRIDKLLSLRFPQYSRSYFQSLIEQGHVKSNGLPLKKRENINPLQQIEVHFMLAEQISLAPEPMDFDLVYEDEYFLVINKPPGLVVHPGPGHSNHTFVNGLLFHCKTLQTDGSLRPGIVHRLDKDTSGLLMAAKTQESHFKLSALFANRDIHKEYLAVCTGSPKEQLIEKAIRRHQTKRQEMAIDNHGKEAVTELIPLLSNSSFSLVRLLPKTGRTHQLRVHLRSIGHPIVGDPIYGNLQLNEKMQIDEQLLHARALEFVHPFTNKKLSLEASIPNKFNRFIEANFNFFN